MRTPPPTRPGKLARAVWTETCCAEEKEGILAVQTARNAISACTFLAATAGIIVSPPPLLLASAGG